MTTVENLAQGAVPSEKRTDNSQVKLSKNLLAYITTISQTNVVQTLFYRSSGTVFCQTHNSFACSVKCLALE